MASGSNPFGGFLHRSPLSSVAHDPLVDLGSHCVREWFGPTVQSVGDLLERCGGNLTLGQVTMGVLNDCSMRVPNAERNAVVTRSLPRQEETATTTRTRTTRTRTTIASVMNRARGPEHAGYVVDVKAIHAALLVLLQHSIVTATPLFSAASASSSSSSPPQAQRLGLRQYKYSYNRVRARLLSRYPRFVEYTKKAVDEVAATLLQEICLYGRMSSEEAAKAAWNALQPEDDDDDDDDDDNANDDAAATKGSKRMGVPPERILQSFQKLVEGGFLEIVSTVDPLNHHHKRSGDFLTTKKSSSNNARDAAPLVGARKRKRSGGSAVSDAARKNPKTTSNQGVKAEPPCEQDNDAEEEDEEGATATKMELHDDDDDDDKPDFPDNAMDNVDADNDNDNNAEEDAEDEIVRLLLSDDRFRHVFPQGAVWRINVSFLHDSLRAFCLGRLVAERYADKVKSAGSIVTAALKLLAFRQHSPLGPKAAMYAARQKAAAAATTGGGGAMGEAATTNEEEELSTFSPDDLLHHLPPKVLNDFKNQSGGARANLSKSLASLAVFSWPQVILEVEDAHGHLEGGKFEVALRPLVDHLRGRVLYQVVHDRHGHVAARICAALQAKGYLEADGVAEAAMIPVKDARELLHQMYRSNYVSSLALTPMKQHNPAQAIYVWGVQKPRFFAAVLHNVCSALYHLRLRRQHEVEVGKDWMDRAGAQEEGNDVVEKDKMEYSRFCQGLERLDHAILQLDETLMVLQEF